MHKMWCRYVALYLVGTLALPLFALAQQPTSLYTCEQERDTLREQLSYAVNNTTQHVGTIRGLYEKQLAAKDVYIAELRQQLDAAKKATAPAAPSQGAKD